MHEPSASTRNIVAIAANGIFFPAAGKILGAGLLLTWFVTELSSSLLIVGAIVPIQYGLALIFQPIFAQWLSRHGHPAAYYRWQAVLRGFLWATLGLVTLSLGESVPKLLLAVFFIVIVIDAIAAGFGNIAFSEALARAIPQRLRGRVRGWRGAAGAVTAGAAGWLVGRLFDQDASAALFGWPFLAGGILYAVGGIVFVRVEVEHPESTSPAPRAASMREGINRVLSNPFFRRFLLVEILLIPLSQGLPYFAMLGKSSFGLETKDIGLLIVADAAAPLVGNLLWGRVADWLGNRTTVIAASASGLLAPATAIYLIHSVQGSMISGCIYAFAFIVFIVGLAAAGIDLATKNLVLEQSLDDAQRPMYIGVNDTVVGLPTFLLIAAGAIIEFTGFTTFLAVMILSAVTAIVLASILPIAQDSKREHRDAEVLPSSSGDQSRGKSTPAGH